MPLKTSILEEIHRSVGERMSVPAREALADRIVAILEGFNRATALAAVETVKSTLVQATSDAETAAEKQRK